MPAGNVAISVRNLGKSYTIAHNATRHVTLAEAMLDRMRHPLRRQKTETFHALTDVSFDIHQGDVVGIIGRNGAGKSTLLKVVSRITAPTSGAIDLWGRVGSLLEVGTGFHPELTGRENIYLNGHILGMSRRQIGRQFDAIVEFAGVEQFLDTPVKRYSSGMYVRLAFAVAAHLDSEILVVDEVLAVGDSEFQKKCLGKMKDVATGGRTVLLVSHNMASVTNLCNHTLVLGRGRLLFSGPTDAAVDFYANTIAQAAAGDVDLSNFRPAWASPHITAARLTDPQGKRVGTFPMGGDIRVEVDFVSPPDAPLRSPILGVVLNHSTNGILGGVNMRMTASEPQSGEYPSGTLTCLLKRPPLLQGTYSLDLWLGDGAGDIDCLIGYIVFEVDATDIYNCGRLPFHYLGSIFLEPQWEFRPAAQPRPAAAAPSTA
jgi:lipopolysaccharide transport system ATP-binding protein